jgi:hypothetical protein
VQARSDATKQYDANEQGNGKIIFDDAHGMRVVVIKNRDYWGMTNIQQQANAYLQ